MFNYQRVNGNPPTLPLKRPLYRRYLQSIASFAGDCDQTRLEATTRLNAEDPGDLYLVIDYVEIDTIGWFHTKL